MNTLFTYFKKCGLVLILLLTTLLFAKQSMGQTVVTNPTSPWTVPAGVTSVKVEIWGGGGGGGSRGGNFFGTRWPGGGGGGGGYRTYTYSGLSAGNTFTFTIGNGAGGNTTIVFSGQTNLVASGGSAGGNGATFSNGAGGAGGGAGSGPAGSTGVAGSVGSTGGGGGANGGNGGNGATANGGAGAAGGTSGNAGIAGVPGGGGGGANTGGNSASSGAVGRVVFTYTACIPPAAPAVTSPVAYCQNATATALTATGTSLLWYTTATGGTGSSTAPMPVTTTVGTTSYYVSQTIGCESPRANINVIINALPVASVPNQTNISCFGGADGTITVSASSGTGPYTFSINNGVNYFPATGTNLRQFTGLLPNSAYQIKVKDTNGCISN